MPESDPFRKVRAEVRRLGPDLPDDLIRAVIRLHYDAVRQRNIEKERAENKAQRERALALVSQVLDATELSPLDYSRPLLL